jgi:hypothetical protein
MSCNALSGPLHVTDVGRWPHKECFETAAQLAQPMS